MNSVFNPIFGKLCQELLPSNPQLLKNVDIQAILLQQTVVQKIETVENVENQENIKNTKSNNKKNELEIKINNTFAGDLFDVESDGIAVNVDITEKLSEIKNSSLFDVSQNNNSQSLIGTTDLEALRSWLLEYTDSPQTYRHYRKEGERFYLWCHFELKKEFFEINRADVDSYQKFLANPPESWLAKRHTHRNSDEWRPFEGKLSISSQNHTLVIVKAFFNYCVDAGFLTRNPFKLMKKKLTKKADMMFSQKQNKFLPYETFKRLLSFLQYPIKDENPTQYQQRERRLFILSWFYYTGCRREEAAKACISDLYQDIDPQTGQVQWFWQCVGKGKKHREIPLYDTEAIAALRRYRSLMGQDFDKLFYQQSTKDAPIILPVRGESHCLSDQQLYYEIMQTFKFAAQYLLEDIHWLNQATPHWLRHSRATHLRDQGKDLLDISTFLGHSSLQTTAIYSHVERRKLWHNMKQNDR